MFGRKKVMDEEAEQLLEFTKNVEKADSFREQFQGNFIAVFDKEVIGFDTEFSCLMNKIPEQYLDKKQMYISYMPKHEEVLLL